MSERAARRVLWLTFLLAVPMPMVVVGSGRVPVARFLFLAGLSLAVLIRESARGSVGLLAAFFAGHAVVHGALLWLAAAVLGRALGRWRRPGAVLLALGLVLAASVFPIFRCPYHPSAARSTLLGVYR
jgi:hypothetical protein